MFGIFDHNFDSVFNTEKIFLSIFLQKQTKLVNLLKDENGVVFFYEIFFQN